MDEKPGRGYWIVVGVYAIAAILIMYASAGIRAPAPKTVDYSEFLKAIREEKLDSVRIQDSQFIGVLKATPDRPVAESIITPRLPQTDEALGCSGVAGPADQDCFRARDHELVEYAALLAVSDSDARVPFFVHCKSETRAHRIQQRRQESRENL
jgi:hypothetical protein